MKKVLALILAVTMLLSVSVTSYALSYGEEWNEYYHTAPVTFTDVSFDHWAYNAIMRVYEKNWFSGYPDNSFRPNASITRAEALKVFVMFLGLDYQSVDLSDISFYDISATDWYAPFVEAGKDLFPTHTTIQGKRPFNPNMPVTREDTIYALVRALGCHVGIKYTDQSVLNMFSDKSSISGDMKHYFAIALHEGLVSGFPDGTIRAQAALTRAEFATLLLRGTEHGFHDTYESKIDTVSVSPASLDMSVGETVTLNARATYTDGSNKEYTDMKPYVADGMNVISISGTSVTALKDGKATIKFNDADLKNKSISVVVNKPTDAPTLKVTDYFDVTEDSSMTIKGTATYKNEIVDLTCNGKDVAVSKDGSFSTTVSLKVGVNNIKFVAVNSYGVEASKNITIERKETYTAPDPVDPEEEEEDDDNNGNNSTGNNNSHEDGEDYLEFDDETGTVTACGTSVADIEVPAKIDGVNVYHIGDGAFKGCIYLETIELPYAVKSIGSNAFYGCSRLFEFEVPEETTKIGESAFENCKVLTSVSIPEGVKKLSKNLFYGCKRLVEVLLSEGLNVIGESAFEKCTSLEEIVLPESVKEIESNAFLNCGSLEMIEIPDNVTEIADDAFDGCNALTIYASVNSYAIQYAKDHGIAWKVIE